MEFSLGESKGCSDVSISLNKSNMLWAYYSFYFFEAFLALCPFVFYLFFDFLEDWSDLLLSSIVLEEAISLGKKKL